MKEKARKFLSDLFWTLVAIPILILAFIGFIGIIINN